MHTEGEKYIKLVIWLILLSVIGSAIGFLARHSINTWYSTLNLSVFTPPNYTFGIVWTILYALIAFSGWIIWETKSCVNLPKIKKLYIIQMILNWLWLPLFFNYQFMVVALICLIFMGIAVAMIIFKSYKNITAVSLLMTPYLLWIIFALYLNFYILFNN